MSGQSSAQAPAVLVVDDEGRLRETLTRMIRALDFPVWSAGSAEEAMRMLRGGRTADIAVLDLHLPAMHGMDLFEWLTHERPATRVVVLTGFGDLETAQRSIRLGVVDFLSKPCTLGDLERAMHRAWEQLRRQRAAPVQPTSDPHVAGHTRQTLREVERRQIHEALNRHGGNRRLAAAELGISLRTLYYRLAQHEV